MRNREPAHPACLLTMPTYGGTLAAARCFGQHGVPITVVGSELLAPARWSRHATTFFRCPPPRESERFLSWLLEFGDRHPGLFLYPTSDDLAWLFAANAAELSRHFVLYQPPVETIVRVLDKKTLYEACAEVGIGTVPTWFPASPDAAEKLSAELTYPLLIKPRTQVMLTTGNKGVLVESAGELLRRYHAFLARDRYLPALRADFGDLSYPMLQSFCPQAPGGIYSVTGFVDERGELLGARAARKVLQRPRRVGIGICFEEAKLDTEVAEAIARLCRRVGYFGVFEAELIADGPGYRLIDFNPRYYGQMALDVARGLPLPLFAWCAAKGDREGLRALSDKARAFPEGQGYVYCDRFAFALLLGLRRLAGSTSADEYRRWSSWYSSHQEHAVDASAQRGDRLPGLVHAAVEMWSAARHARAFYRGCVRDEN